MSVYKVGEFKAEIKFRNWKCGDRRLETGGRKLPQTPKGAYREYYLERLGALMDEAGKSPLGDLGAILNQCSQSKILESWNLTVRTDTI